MNLTDFIARQREQLIADEALRLDGYFTRAATHTDGPPPLMLTIEELDELVDGHRRELASIDARLKEAVEDAVNRGLTWGELERYLRAWGAGSEDISRVRRVFDECIASIRTKGEA